MITITSAVTTFACTLALLAGSVKAEALKCADTTYPWGLLELQEGTSVQVPGVVSLPCSSWADPGCETARASACSHAPPQCETDNQVNTQGQKIMIHESTSQQHVPLCYSGKSDKLDPLKFSVSWYAFDRLKEGSFPTFTLFVSIIINHMKP